MVTERRKRESEWPEELERCGALLEQGEEEQDSYYPLTMAVEQQPGLSIPSPIERKPSEIKSPSHTVAGVERTVYRKSPEQAMRSEFEGHIKTGTFSTVDRIPEGRKGIHADP